MENIKNQECILSETTEIGPKRERGASLINLERGFINRDHLSRIRSHSHQGQDDGYGWVKAQRRTRQRNPLK